MKKNVKTIMGGFLSVALLAGFISCSNGTSDETNQAAQGLNLSGASSASGTAIAENIYSGDLITFKATAASVDSENVNLIIKYDRSAAGAKELISLTDVELEVKHNGTAISMPSTIKFELDEYGALFDNKKDSEHYKEYKGKLSINKKIVSGDTVTVQLNKAKVSGEGAASVKLDNVLISLIDTAPTAGKTGYYNELCPNNEEYKPLITKKNGKGLNEVETPAPANNTPENPAPANPTPENPTPANNTSTDTNNTTTPAATTLTKTSILSGIQAGDNVWDSGTKTTQNSNGTYNVIAAGAGVGTWGGNIAAVPVCFGAGDLTGFTHIVLEADLSTFNLGGSDEYPGIELKVANADDTKTKVINATNLFNNGKAEISLSTVDFLDTAEKIIISFRGTGSLTVNDISKAK